MYTFLSHSPGAMKLYGEYEEKVHVEEGMDVDLNTVLCGLNYFGYDLEKDTFGELEVLTLQPFSDFLHHFSHYALQAMYVDGFGESLEEMMEESGTILLYPKFTRDYIMENFNLKGKMKFNELPKEFRTSEFGKDLRMKAVEHKYGGLYARQVHKCPVCGKYTFERFDFEVCPECRYIDSYARYAKPDDKEGYFESLNEIRKLYRKGSRDYWG